MLLPTKSLIFKYKNCRVLWLAAVVVLSGCSDKSLNDPYPNEPAVANTFYSSFAERPKHLDPARSYSSGEWTIISQIYEPPLAYHYLKRPYELIPLISAALPTVRYFSADHREIELSNNLSDNVNNNISYSIYEITIQPGVYYQPHPAFATNEHGEFYYQQLISSAVAKYRELADFSHTGSREVVAEDFVYQIKRLADPAVQSPIYGFLSQYIVGLAELRQTLLQANAATDLRSYQLTGVQAIDKYRYQITINGHYPQFKYWLAMPFFAPVPWEADHFYQQPGMSERNITLDWYPVGTGAYMLVENNPERRMVMQRNPNYRQEVYPSAGEPGDAEHGLLVDAGQKLPFVDKIMFSLEKENIPYWNKFLQGYYDASGISSDNFNSAIDITPDGSIDVSKQLKDKAINLQTTTAVSTMYWAFNMLDEVVGGYSVKAKKLRQAIAIAFDVEEFISIFLNGRGISAQDPLPPEILNFNPGVNELIYNPWRVQDQNQEQAQGLALATKPPQRRSIQQARQLLAEAGYPDGRDSTSGEQLIINFEAISSGDPEEKAIFTWLRKQLAKLNIELVIRVTDYNRFREKIHNGDAQMFFWGWNADYPDPENFLFLFYGPNGKVKYAGENAANYHNTQFDNLFKQMRAMVDGEQRNNLIKEMIQILRQDTPWIWGFHPQSYSLYHAWYRVTKPNSMAHNTLKYVKIDPQLRAQQRVLWNTPVVWPLIIAVLLLLSVTIPAWLAYRQHEASAAKRLK